jgi:hypothetical protein
MGAATFHRFPLWVRSNDLPRLFMTTRKSIWHRITDAISYGRGEAEIWKNWNPHKTPKMDKRVDFSIQINFSSAFVLNASPKILHQIDFPLVLNSRGKALDRTQSWNLWKVAAPICCFTTTSWKPVLRTDSLWTYWGLNRIEHHLEVMHRHIPVFTIVNPSPQSFLINLLPHSVTHYIHTSGSFPALPYFLAVIFVVTRPVPYLP